LRVNAVERHRAAVTDPKEEPMFDTDVRDLQGCQVVDSNGDKIGSIEEIYLDDETNQPEFARVKTGLLGGSQFVPLQQADLAGGEVRVPYSKDQVKGAPDVSGGEHLSQQEEAELYRYYGLSYSERRSDTGLPEGGGMGGAETDVVTAERSTSDDAMTRSEEELRVGTREREAGRARLR
jgi:sporulation protein YlmC with PRC-barrel domain